MRYISRRRAHLTVVPSAVALLGLASLAHAQDPVAAPAPADPAPPAAAAVTTEAAPAAVVEVAPPPQAEETAVPDGLDLSVAFGVGLRTEFIIDPDRDDPQDSPVYTMNHNLRPYINGQVHEYLKFEGNLDSDAENIRVLDAVLKFEFHEYFNLWAGHFLPPSDRANLSGPYFQNAWTYPTGVHIYPSGYAGRNDGLAVWGQVNGGQFKWQLGLFDMANGMGDGTPDPRFAGRLTFNVLDPEPGYYNSSTYYGTKDVLAFGAVLHHIPAAEGEPDEAADTLWNLDALYENSFAGAGTLDVEAAFYGFGGADAGTSFFALASFLFQSPVGIGQLQPMVRFQRAGFSDEDTFGGITAPVDTDASITTIDAGLHYVISGHNARLAATVQHESISVGDADSVTDTVFILGAQIQAF